MSHPHEGKAKCNINTRSLEEVVVWSMTAPKALHSNSKNNKLDQKIKIKLIRGLEATSRLTQIKDIWN
jgi:hypothetical protein